ncbi:MAG: response regulator [SAR324 cluster bacterium]|nr:response regulator [SAR324 cluster bacterium]
MSQEFATLPENKNNTSSIHMTEKSKILIVEGTPNFLFIIKKLMDQAEVEVVAATSGQEALKLLSDCDYALIILEVEMPGMDGYEAAQLIRADDELQKIPLIFVSNVYAPEHEDFRGYQQGAVDFITTPIDSRVLINKVKTFVNLDQHQKERIGALKIQQLLNNNLLETTSNLQEEITKREKAENELIIAKEQAEKANQAKSAFLANLTHDIRTPLGAIIGFNQILMEKSKALSLPEEFLKFQQNIQTSSQSLLEMINNFLDISKIEAGKMAISIESFNLKNLVQEIFDTHTLQALQKGVLLHQEISPLLPSVVCSDKSKITQILHNLLGNAIKFTPAKKNVTLKVMGKKDEVAFMVIDEGMGISEERKQAIFEPFEQQDETIVHHYGGTGLGLTITKTLTEILGGNISVISRPDHGSTFSVILPITESCRPEEEKQLSDLKDLSFSSDNLILVVDDNQMNQMLIKALFRGMGLEIQQADNGETAVAKVLEFKANNVLPNVIFMDMQMPGIDGLEATRQIRQHPGCQDIPIVALSADAFAERKQAAEAVGIKEYLTKPIDVEKLNMVLRRYLS